MNLEIPPSLRLENTGSSDEDFCVTRRPGGDYGIYECRSASWEAVTFTPRIVGAVCIVAWEKELRDALKYTGGISKRIAHEQSELWRRYAEGK